MVGVLLTFTYDYGSCILVMSALFWHTVSQKKENPLQSRLSIRITTGENITHLDKNLPLYVNYTVFSEKKNFVD